MTNVCARAAPIGVETVDASPPEAAAPEPIACSDAGPAAWYLVTTGTKCVASSTLEWLDGRTPHLLGDMPPLLDAFAWADEMPDCFGANANITKVQAIDDHTFAVVIDGHDNGGSGCHASFKTHYDGRVIVDGDGAIVRADFTGTETTAVDDVPDCRSMAGVEAVTTHVRRSCEPERGTTR